MASRYEDKKAYKANIDTLLGQIERCTSGFAKITDYKKNKSDYSVSFIRPPIGVTHGEKIHIQLERMNDSETIVHIVSESLIKEFDCGNNRTNTETVLHNLDAKYQSVSLSTKTQRNKTVTKIISIVLVIALLIGCVFIVKSCIDASKSGDGEWETCHNCGGDGKVVNDLGINVTCPRCNGVGYLP